jgi:hypothetical protein
MCKELAKFADLLLVPNRVASPTAIGRRCGKRCACPRRHGAASLNQKPSKPGILLKQRVNVVGVFVTPKSRFFRLKGIFDHWRTSVVGRFVSPK